MENSFGLRDYRLEVDGDGLRGLGAIEGNVGKFVEGRMKRWGMSWTIEGAQRMARLISLREMGELHSWITRKGKLEINEPPRRQISLENPTYMKDSGAWLEAGLLVCNRQAFFVWALSRSPLDSSSSGAGSWGSGHLILMVIQDFNRPTVDNN